MQCPFCEWSCELDADSYGVCRMYFVDQGEIRQRFPNRWSYAVSRMESLPFFHAYPGSRCLTIGTTGCNFKCRYCSNAYVALQDPDTLAEHFYDMTPEDLVRLAQKLNCRSSRLATTRWTGTTMNLETASI